MRTFMTAAATAALLVFTAGAASAQSSVSVGATAGAGASDSGGGVGDIFSLGAAAPGAAYCTDSLVIGPFGGSRTMRECVARDMIAQMVGAGTTTHAEARAMQLAVLEQLGYRIEYREVGGQTTTSSRMPEPTAPTPQPASIEPVTLEHAGERFMLTGEQVVAWNNCEIQRVQLPSGSTLRIQQPGC